jgi:hypothetical protein
VRAQYRDGWLKFSRNFRSFSEISAIFADRAISGAKRKHLKLMMFCAHR